MSKKKKKKAEKQLRPKFCFISFSAEDIKVYGPQNFSSCSEALEALRFDMENIAAKAEYKYEDIFIGSRNYVEREVIKLWSKD